ncbi:hypothetical protein HDV64DRAFT_125067 [Trichoderma sp. TUCIM 5745]
MRNAWNRSYRSQFCASVSEIASFQTQRLQPGRPIRQAIQRRLTRPLLYPHTSQTKPNLLHPPWGDVQRSPTSTSGRGEARRLLGSRTGCFQGLAGSHQIALTRRQWA